MVMASVGVGPEQVRRDRRLFVRCIWSLRLTARVAHRTRLALHPGRARSQRRRGAVLALVVVGGQDVGISTSVNGSPFRCRRALGRAGRHRRGGVVRRCGKPCGVCPVGLRAGDVSQRSRASHDDQHSPGSIYARHDHGCPVQSAPRVHLPHARSRGAIRSPERLRVGGTTHGCRDLGVDSHAVRDRPEDM